MAEQQIDLELPNLEQPQGAPAMVLDGTAGGGKRGGEGRPR